MLSRKGPGGVFTRGKRWDGTVAGDRGNRAMSVDEVRLLKTQDVGYIRTVRNVATKEVRGLEERVIALGGSLNPADEEDDDDEWEDENEPAKKKAKKIVFFDGVPAREKRLDADADAEMQEDQHDDDDEDDENGPKKEANPEALRKEEQRELLSKLQRRLLMARRKLKILARAENQLELQRAKMAKTATSGGTTKSGQKIRVRERKR
jgi:U3 small nucleolar RNA-associated protein 11